MQYTRELEFAADKILYDAESAEREAAMEAARNRTRPEWEALEDDYRADHTHTTISWEDVEADLLDAVDAAATDEERSAAYEHYLDNIMYYRECAHALCEGIFDTRKKRAGTEYCSEACRKAEENGLNRLAATGTYLPSTAYIPKRAASEEKAYQKREIAWEPQELAEYTPKKRKLARKKETRTFPNYNAFVDGAPDVRFLSYGGREYKNISIKQNFVPQKSSILEGAKKAPKGNYFIDLPFTNYQPIKVGGEMNEHYCR